MTTLQRKMNQLADADWGWWPLRKLRPKKEEAMSPWLVTKVAFTFGSGIAAAMLGFYWWQFHEVAPRELLLICICSLAYFFLTFGFFARAWNARAAEIRLAK